jgi:hypothetical protein
MRCINIYKTIIMIVFLVFVPVLFAANGMNAEKYEQIVNRMVDAINAGNYQAVQRDFSEIMLSAFPLEVSRPFFDNLKEQYGRIQRLDTPNFVPPNQAVFPAHCERGILNVRVVLDDKDKITGLWFQPGTAAAESIDPNDPNAAARREWLEQVKGILEDIEKQSEEEVRIWLENRGDRRTDQARRVYTQVENEYNELREVAEGEGASKTVELINKILQAREKRLEEIEQKIEDERRKERLRERESRRRDTEDRRRERDRSTGRTTREREY